MKEYHIPETTITSVDIIIIFLFIAVPIACSIFLIMGKVPFDKRLHKLNNIPEIFLIRFIQVLFHFIGIIGGMMIINTLIFILINIIKYPFENWF